MTGLDTNVLLDWVLGRSVEDLPGTPPYRVSLIVLAELVWVLGTMNRPRAEIGSVVGLLLASRELSVAARETVEAALADYATGRADFADYLIAWENVSGGCSTTWTRDRKAARHPRFRLAR